jgi:DNA-binding NarL/FixJ family response regulator
VAKFSGDGSVNTAVGVLPVRILLADDHRIVSDSLASFLESEPGFTVVGKAVDGEEALKLAQQHNPDLAILDVSMPRLSGIEVARILKQKHPGISVIMLSMHDDSEHIYRALEAGARGYVLKECAGRELIAAVRAVQAGHTYLAQSITSTVVSDYLQLREEHPGENPVSILSGRELQVLKLQAGGVSTLEIAESLHLSPKTVETYRYRIKEKLNIRENTGLVRFAIRHGLVPLDG